MRNAREMIKRRLAAAAGACECGAKFLVLIPACVVALLSSLDHPARAQMTLIEDSGSHAILGPKAAAGAVVWSHGRSVDEEDSLARTPGYIETFRRRGWDAFRLNRLRAGDTLRAASQMLTRLAARLKTDGYRRVVLAGHSYGAFISLMAADSSDDVDAVIAVAPAAYGAVEENPAMGALNASRLYPLLERIRHARVMLFYFADDIFDPGGRGSRSERILTAHRRPHLVFDRPASLTTHWAGSTEEFASRFGPCIVGFAAEGAGAASACRAVEQAAASVVGARTEPSAKIPSRVAKPLAATAHSGGSAKR